VTSEFHCSYPPTWAKSLLVTTPSSVPRPRHPRLQVERTLHRNESFLHVELVRRAFISHQDLFTGRRGRTIRLHLHLHPTLTFTCENRGASSFHLPHYVCLMRWPTLMKLYCLSEAYQRWPTHMKWLFASEKALVAGLRTPSMNSGCHEPKQKPKRRYGFPLKSGISYTTSRTGTPSFDASRSFACTSS